ncbi:MAG TPA: ABC transporter ATP-binding protein [Pseudonocardiaceae bacterium]|nr:ABC transporter ATP-binding protein [Pseudonocardiaceae bacterium]
MGEPGDVAEQPSATVAAKDRPRPIIELEHVGKRFTGDGERTSHEALQDVNLSIDRGRFVCLVGPSGCGKSTVLNMIAGLITPSEGTLRYAGGQQQGINTHVGYITQKDTLLPWRRLERNVSIALEYQGVSRQERRQRVRSVIEQVGLAGFEKYYPAQLSGGMRKRATLARTLVYEPETLLLDEPFGAVDAIQRVTLHKMLLDLWERAGLTVIFVTHDLEEALLLADEVVVFGTKPGRIVHRESVPFERPRDILSLRGNAEFGELLSALWHRLEASNATTGIRPGGER